MVMIDFFGALRRGELEAAAELLDPDVSRQGLREEWVCHGRQEVIDTFHWGIEQRREIDGLEPLGQIFNVFTLRDGRIVRIDDYRGRRGAHGSRRRGGRGLALIRRRVIGRNGPSDAGSLQRRLEERGAGSAVWPWAARFTHSDVRIGGRLVEP
jgi:hypothetical protein